VTGHLPEYWSDLQNKGVAPTALERYVACPFQFFASHILDLRPVKRPEEQSVMESSEIGKLIHAVLKAFFQKLIDGGFFSGSGESIDLDCLLESIARGIFRDYEAEKPVGYRILWEIIQEQIITLVREQVRRDLKDLREAGRSPVGLEIDLRGQLPTDWPRPAAALPIHGALDRIDFDHKTMSYRVVDYKFTMRNKPSTADNNLRLAAIRGQKLQPPLYLFLAKEFAAQNNIKATASEAAFYYLAPQWDEGPLLQQLFSSEDLEGACGQSLRETVSLLIRGIYDGLYFIQPGDACRACEVAHVCRKNHLPTSWRTAHDSLTQAHAEAVKRDMPKE
jgi:ATP-dependent helicase/nuclease subunit B